MMGFVGKQCFSCSRSSGIYGTAPALKGQAISSLVSDPVKVLYIYIYTQVLSDCLGDDGKE